MTDMPAARTTRAERMTMPLAPQVVKDLAVEHGACIRPIQLRCTNLDTGQVDQVFVPRGHTLAHVCLSCAERAKSLRACIGYLTKYLTKHVGGCHQADTDAQRTHAARLAEALRYQPCSPRCANWLRYGIQPKNARPGLAPGGCKGKAHDADHLGYAGRRVLVSRKWSGKTLADHRADRKEWLLRTLGVSATDPARYAWEPVAPSDPDHMEHTRRMLHVVGVVVEVVLTQLANQHPHAAPRTSVAGVVLDVVLTQLVNQHPHAAPWTSHVVDHKPIVAIQP